MGTELHWVDGPWPGKLAVSSRPRGGDWVEDEVASWRRAGIDTVLSLLTPEEEQTLDLSREAGAVKTRGMDFISLPIPDRQVPGSETEVASALERVNTRLTAGKNVVVHCRQGVGRSGLIYILARTRCWSTARRGLRNASGALIDKVPGQIRVSVNLKLGLSLCSER